MTQPGWYPDQNGGAGKKYWDGQKWHDAKPTASAPPVASTPGPVPNRKNKSLRYVLAAAAVVVGGFLAVDGFSRIGRHRPPPSAPFPSILDQSVTSQDAALGKPLAVHLSGNRSEPTAGVAVGNLQPVPRQPYMPVSGDLYAVFIIVNAVDGTSTVDPSGFSARTEYGTNLRQTVVIGQHELPATELPQGQKVSGWITFDVPRGQRITEIILSAPLGAQLARWKVP